MRLLSRQVQPCVFAATLKAMLGGWTTKAAAPCLFGCRCGQDAIEHYAFCSCVARLMRSRLNLHLGPATTRLDAFLLLDDAAPDTLASRALGLYATFKATNAARHGLTSAEGAWLQALAEGSASIR